MNKSKLSTKTNLNNKDEVNESKKSIKSINKK
jgi:hypothetical protein